MLGAQNERARSAKIGINAARAAASIPVTNGLLA
jgi:hypothetical protein